MSGDDLRVALIPSNEQIKFVSVACPDDADPITINEHILRTMDGATPYHMDELRFDHHLADGTLMWLGRIETLNEAEEFAKNYGLFTAGLHCVPTRIPFQRKCFSCWRDAPLGIDAAPVDEEPEEEIEESAPPVIAFARRDTPEIQQSSPQPRLPARRVLALPRTCLATGKPLAATNDAIIAKQSELGAKIAARIAEYNAGNPGAHLRFCCC